MTEEKDSANEQEEKYDSSKIQKLEGLEGVRKRPDMYIGDTNERGLHHCVFEIVDNSIDESLAGFCSEITVHLHTDGSCSIQDDGKDPRDMHPKHNMPALELVLTNLHAEVNQKGLSGVRRFARSRSQMCKCSIGVVCGRGAEGWKHS